ncbi:MAG: PEP-utilizing enzyme [Verrucomicrobia bacterium]|nr:PEP-utilizing enzyme [Verrucomicrobiota bacterium]
MAEKMIYFFGGDDTEGDPGNKELLGGKGASLAAMSKAGLPVPAGFTITTECCEQFFERKRQWPKGLEEALREYMTRLESLTGRRFGDPDSPLLVSVRSGAARSMPGMMDTILNCGLPLSMAESCANPAAFWRVYNQFVIMFSTTVADISRAEFEAMTEAADANTAEERAALSEKLRACYAEKSGNTFPTTPWESLIACIDAVFDSWNSERAITYRREHDLRGLKGTAVNVQSMFPSEVSGIVFTTNPNNLPAEEMVIESSFGLGESVVSGDVQPDKFVVDRETRRIKESVIGHKSAIIYALGDAGERDPDAPSLTADQLSELAEMCMKVEGFFGYAVDIEFGLVGGEFGLLQSRAIRGLDIVRDVEVGRQEEIERLRELAAGRRRVWVFHNLGETLRSPTPLTWDLIRHFMRGDGGFGRMYQDFGYRPSRRVRDEGFLELICGRIYADSERLAELFWENMPFEYDLDLIEHDEGAMEQAPSKFNPELAGGRFLWTLPGTLWAMLKSARRMKQLRARAMERFEKDVLPPYLAYVKEQRARDLTVLSTPEVIAEFEQRLTKVLDEFANESLQPGFFGGLARSNLETMLNQLMGKEEGSRLALDLTMGLEGDLTVAQNETLYEVAQKEETFEVFMERFGHRTVGEMELAVPRWREEHDYLEKVMASYQGSGTVHPSELHYVNRKKREQAEAELPDLLVKHGGSAFEEDILTDLRDAQKLLPMRENGKYYLMMGYELLRLAILELARRWDLGRDVFFLNRDELEHFEHKTPHLTVEIAARKTRWQSAKRLEVATVVNAGELESLGMPREYADTDELEADSISSGVSTGTAKIIFDPNEAGDLGHEYVLVCPSTDPGWTPLFVRCTGLVIERGGILSHGAIVARDFGIPAVVCPGATKRIPDGARVRVDGNRGSVTVLKGDE